MSDKGVVPEVFPLIEEKAKPIPVWMARLGYVSYRRKYGSQQSLKRLAERGGFGQIELIHLLAEHLQLAMNCCACLLDEQVGAGGDLGYHLEVDGYTDLLREVVGRKGKSECGPFQEKPKEPWEE